MVFQHIRDLRDEKGLNQKEVADILGVAQNTYSQYETGKIELTAPILLFLADFYQVSVDFLLDRTTNPKINYLTAFPHGGGAPVQSLPLRGEGGTAKP